jgi:hypothetical protein
MSCNISSENGTIWRMVIGGMMELYSDGFSMLKCISMWIVLIDVISKAQPTCQLMKAQYLQTTSNGTHFWIKSLDGLAATMNLTQNNDVHH